MAKTLTCPPCGEQIRAESDDDLVEKVQAHAREEHGMELSREQILADARED